MALPSKSRTMVVNIMKSVPLMDVTILYNESKVERDTATILSAVNMDGPSEDDIRRTLERYEKLSIRTRNLSFHMAINPLDGQDHMTDNDIVRFAGKMMEGMGYGEQPYVVYKHEDTERVHYHVLSIRVDRNGRKINDYQERWKCYHLVRDLEAEFDYKVGNRNAREKKSYVDRFDPRKGDTVEQIRQLFNDSLQYRFTSYAQFEMILRAHGIAVEEHSGHTTTLCLQGMDEKGKPCTRRLMQSAFKQDMYRLYSDRALANIDVMKGLAMERNRIRTIAAESLPISCSQAHFRQLLARKGISIRIDRDPETHRISGADIVDNVTRCAFKLSDLGPDFSLEMLQDADANQWERGDHDPGVDITLGDFLAGLGGRPSKSHEKDIKDDPKKKKKNLRF